MSEHLHVHFGSANLQWRKSTVSNPSGNCVELAELAWWQIAVAQLAPPGRSHAGLHPRRDLRVHPGRAGGRIRRPRRVSPNLLRSPPSGRVSSVARLPEHVAARGPGGEGVVQAMNVVQAQPGRRDHGPRGLAAPRRCASAWAASCAAAASWPASAGRQPATRSGPRRPRSAGWSWAGSGSRNATSSTCSRSTASTTRPSGPSSWRWPGGPTRRAGGTATPTCCPAGSRPTWASSRPRP